MHKLLVNLRLFWQGAILSYLALFSWLRPITFLASMVIFPLGQLVFFTFLGMYATGATTASFYLIGNAMQITASSGIYGITMTIGGERWSGTLPYLFGTPSNRLAMFVGRAVPHIFNGVFEVVMGLTWGILLGWVDLSHTDLPALALTILVTTISTAGLGLLLGCLSLITLNVMLINNTVYFLLLVFCGVNIPLAALPGWMQAVSFFLPLTRGIAAARAIIAGNNLAEVSPLLVGEMLVGAGYVFIGYLFFRWFEFQAKRRGTLEAF